MKVYTCTKVYDTSSDGLMVETLIAFTEGAACKALAELEGFEVGPGDGYSSDPFDFADEISQDGRTFHVEEHEVDFEQPARNALKDRLASDMRDALKRDARKSDDAAGIDTAKR